MSRRLLLTPLFVAACVNGSPLAPSFTHNGYKHDLEIRNFVASADSASRGDTVMLSFTLTNTGNKAHEYAVVATLRDVPCPPADFCAIELDALEQRGAPHPNAICQAVNPNVRARDHGTLARGESRSFRWSWEVAALACVPPGTQPAAGAYRFQVYAEQERANFFTNSDTAELPFRFTEL